MFQAAKRAPLTIFIFALVWSASAAYLGSNLKKDWDPADEGTLGQMAERVLDGEIQHRDFPNGYTGGLTYIDALIFKIFGIDLFYLRLFLFGVFLAWVPAVYGIALHFLRPWIACGITLLAVLWSVPNYPAAMPSWFSLFLTTFGILALATYIRRPATRWLILAGFCGGISFLVKSVALYYIAGAFLFFVYREQALARKESLPAQSTRAYLAFLTASLTLFVLVLIKLVFALGGMPDYLHFVFPGLAIAIFLIARESSPPNVPNSTRLATLLKMVIPFMLSAGVPISLFFIFSWWQGSLQGLVRDLFVTPFRGMSVPRSEPVGLLFEYPAVIAVLLIIEVSKLRGLPRRILSVFLPAVALLVLVGARRNDLAYLVGITSALGLIPVLALATLLVLWRTGQIDDCSVKQDQCLVLLFAMTTLFSLIQFPFSPSGSSLGYFGYVAPLATLLAAALVSRLSHPPFVILWTAFAFYALFAVLVLKPHYRGGHPRPDSNDTVLSSPRAGGLVVTKKSAMEYAELIPFVKSVAGQQALFAGPDCPEVYFLTGIKNQTPILYDSLTDPNDYEAYIKSLFGRPNFLKVAVLHDAPISGAYQLQILRPLAVSRFPNSRKIGSFTVYWRP